MLACSLVACLSLTGVDHCAPVHVVDCRQQATLEHSKYSAAQFIKLTAQIDALREQLHRERLDRCVRY
jgi:hypothetical protein